MKHLKVNRKDAKSAKKLREVFASFASSRFNYPLVVFVACSLVALACARTDVPIDYNNVTPVGESGPFGFFNDATAAPGGATSGDVYLPADGISTLVPPTSVVAGSARTARPTQDISVSPTLDAPRASALNRTNTEQYTVQRGDTLNEIGSRYGVTGAQIAQASGIQVTDTLFVGQMLTIPLPDQSSFGPDLKLLPNSELVYGPSTADFNLEAYVQAQGGYLAGYAEDIPAIFLDGRGPCTLTGTEILRLVATRYSVHPQVLLALLEYQSGWVTNPQPDGNTLTFPLRRVEVNREGLYRQLAWAANKLNEGYYGWRAGWLVSFQFPGGQLRLINTGLNSGTVAVHNYFAQISTVEEWTRAVTPGGFDAVYARLFGNPFRYAVEPLVPDNLVPTQLILPFEPSKAWAFTGGPHGAWDTGSAWGALDFAPPAEIEGCVQSEEWAVAAAPGVVVRSEYGALVIDLDDDGFEGTGWSLFYMHLEQRDRAPVGTFVNTGDQLGHPSCEGGVSNGTHIHFSRKYNGEWIEAGAGLYPFVLDGWLAASLGREYDGTLANGGRVMEACDCRAEANEISRP